jgi:hypothetical protein
VGMMRGSRERAAAGAPLREGSDGKAGRVHRGWGFVVEA